MISMKNLFQNFSTYGISNNYAKSLFYLIEVSQILIFIDIIFPITFSQNYYFPIYFLDLYLYIEYYILKSSSDTSCDIYYDNKKNFNETISTDQMRTLIQKYLKTNSPTINLCKFPMIFLYIAYGIFFSILLFYFILAFDISQKQKKNSKEKEKNSTFIILILKILFTFAANFIYFFTKTISQTYFTLISNFFIYPIFYYDSINDQNIFLITSLLIFFGIIAISIIFMNFFLDSFNKKTFDQLIKKNPENSLLALKVILSILINFRFNTKFLDFVKFIAIMLFLYNCYSFFEIFKKTNIKTFSFYSMSFYLALFLDRLISNIASHYTIDGQATDNSMYYGFHMFLHFSLLLLIIVIIYFEGKKNERLTVDNLNYKIFSSLSDLLENMLNNPLHSYNKENNSLRLKIKNLREIKLLFLDHQLVCVDNFNCYICTKINALSRLKQSEDYSVDDEIKELAKMLLKYSEKMNNGGNKKQLDGIIFKTNKDNHTKDPTDNGISNIITEEKTNSDKNNYHRQNLNKENLTNKGKILNNTKIKNKNNQNHVNENKDNHENEETHLKAHSLGDYQNYSRKIPNELNFSIKKSLSQEESEINNLLKIIYLLIIDQEKIHRVSYFIKTFNKNASYKFDMILKNLYEKIINHSLDEEDKNFILQKCVELNEEYFSIINILSGFVEALNGEKTKDLKIIIEKNDVFGDKYKSIVKEMKFFHEKYKFKEPSQYYKYLWCYGILFNQDFDSETYLDSPENFEILDLNFHKNSNFILKYDHKTFSWIIKKVPEIFINRFGYDYKDLLDKSYEMLFPTILKNYEKKRLDQMMMADQRETQKIKTIMQDFHSYLRTIEISFDILPFISENNFTVCNIHKIEERHNDNLMIINEKGEIINISKSVSAMLGITPDIIMLYKDRMNMNKLFKILVDDKVDELKEIKLNYIDYLNYFVNTYLVDSGLEEIYEFINLTDEVKKHDKGQNKINVVLHMEKFMQINLNINYFIFRVNNFFEQNSILSQISKANFKRTFRCEDPNFNVENEMDPILENLSQTNTYTQSSMATDYFSSATKVTGKINRGSQSYMENGSFLSNLIIFLNVMLIFIGIFIMIYINTNSASLVSIFDIIIQVRKLDSIYFTTLVSFVNLIFPVDIGKFYGMSNDDFLNNGFIKKGKISQEFNNYNFAIMSNNTQNLYTMQNTLMQKMQSYFGDSEFKVTYNTLENYYQMNGNQIKNFFFENLKLNINNLYTLTKLKLSKFQIDNIQDLNALDLDSLSQMIRNQIVNYNGTYKCLLKIGEKSIGLYDQDFKALQIKIYVILFTYLVLHIILIILSFFQVKVFVKKIKYIFLNLSNYNKKEFQFIINKIKSVKQLINVEIKPSDAVNLYKKEKQRFVTELKEEREKQKINEKKNIKKAYLSNEGLEENLDVQKKEEFAIKYNYNFNLITQVINFIVVVTIIYLIYGIIVIVFFTQLFEKIIDCEKAYNYLNNIENISTDYLLNFKLNVLSPYQREVLSQDNLLLNQTFNFIEKYPDNFYESYEGFLKILENSASLGSIKTFYDSLESGKICQSLVSQNSQLLSSFKEDFLKLCENLSLSNMNFYGIYSYYMKNNRNMYLSLLQTPQTWRDSVYSFSNEQSQLLNWIYLIYLNPFILVIKDIILYDIYQYAMHQLTLYCIICFTSIIFIDIFIFMMMKVKVINKISSCQFNLIVISNTIQV